MKTLRKPISLLLCFLLLFGLVACGGGKSPDPTYEYGRYVETDITPEGLEGYIAYLHTTEEGRIDLIAVDYGTEETGWRQVYQRFVSDDSGGSWREIDMSWTEEYIHDNLDEDDLPESLPMMGALVLLDDGNLLVQLGTMYLPEYNYDASFYLIGEDGSRTPFDMPGISEAQESGAIVSVATVELLPNNRLMLQAYAFYPQFDEEQGVSISGMDDENIRGIFDLTTGEMVTDLSVWTGWEYIKGEEYLYLEDYPDYIAVDMVSGQIVENVTTPSREMLYSINSGGYSGSGNIAAAPGGDFYLAGTNGLYLLANGAEEAEEVLTGINYTFGSPVAQLRSFKLLGTDAERPEFLLSVDMSQQSGRLLRYHYDEEAAVRSDQSLRVYSLYNSNSVRMAMSEYSRQHPEITLTYEYTYEERGSTFTYGEEDPATLEDTLRQLNTELLSGNGPDVIILDDLPMQSYIQRGVLEDLSDIVSEDVIAAVVDPLRTDGGKLYTLPTRFSLPLLYGEKGYVEQFTTLDDLLDEVDSRPGITAGELPDYDSFTEEDWDNYYMQRFQPTPKEERPAFGFSVSSDIIQMLFATSGPAIYTEQDGLNKENLADMLVAGKRIADRYDLGRDGDFENNFSGGGTHSSYEGYSYITDAPLQNYTESMTTLGYSETGSFYMLRDTSEAFHYSGAMYVNDTLIERESEDVTVSAVVAPGLHGSVYNPSMVVGIFATSPNKELAKEFVAAMLADDVQRYDLGDGFAVTHTGLAAQYDNYRNRDRYYAEEGVEYIELDFDAIFAGGLEPHYMNTYLLEVIQDAAIAYFAGELTLDETVQAIDDMTQLYFAERQ